MKLYRITWIVSLVAVTSLGVFNCSGNTDSNNQGDGGEGGSAGSSEGGGGGSAGNLGGNSGGSAAGRGGMSSGGSGGVAGAAGGGGGGSAAGGGGGGGAAGGIAGGVGGTGGSGGMAGGAGGAAALTFTADVYPIVMNKCSSCHGTNFKSVNAAYTFLTTSNEKCMDYAKIVVPGMPAKSWMFAKVSSTAVTLPKDCGARMPKDGAMLDAASIKKIEDWIKGGAVK